MPLNNFVMNSEKHSSSKSRSGFSLVEVTLALGIVGMAILSLVGILGATFQQADEIMQTNRALAAATRLIGAFDNPRSIVSLSGGTPTSPPTKTAPAQPLKTYLETNSMPKLSNFDLIYHLLRTAVDNSTSVWFYVYDRKVASAASEFDDSTGTKVYNFYSNPTVTEVAIAKDNLGTTFNLIPNVANQLNIVGTPLRVRVKLSRLLVGQRCEIDPSTFEPGTTTWTWPVSSSLSPSLPPLSPVVVSSGKQNELPSSKYYALAYLPVVAEFFPHDWSSASGFQNLEETPVLVQTIIISR